MNPLPLVALAIFIPAKTLQATILIQDDFFRNAGQPIIPLDNTFATIGANPWLGSDWTVSDGYAQVTSNSSATMALSTLTPQTRYSLTLKIFSLTGGAGWIGMGFTTPNFADISSGAVGGIFRRETDNILQRNVNLFSDEDLQELSFRSPLPVFLKIELTTGDTLASSTISWSINDTQIGENRTVNATPVNGLFIQSGGGRGELESLTLTSEAIPEPSTGLTILLAASAFLTRSRFR